MERNEKLFRCVYEVKRRIRYIRLKEKDISIITNNCLGGKLAHDFGLMLNSPVVNMQMIPEDFVQFCGNLDFYLKKQLEEVKEINEDCKEKFRSVGGGEIEFPVADAPVVTPSTGQYSTAMQISITVPEGYTAYYTTDGSTPTTESSLYTGPIEMPEGQTLFSAVLVSKTGKMTQTTKRNYIYQPQ